MPTPNRSILKIINYRRGQLTSSLIVNIADEIAGVIWPHVKIINFA